MPNGTRPSAAGGSSPPAGDLSADVLVSAMGGLTEPAEPDIPGLETFEGTRFHSATWDHEHDLSGERVASIGTGASAVQYVPKIQPRVDRLHVFQRTPSWVMPDPDRRVTDIEHRLWKQFPSTQRALRSALYVAHESTVLGTIVNRRLSGGLQAIARRHLSTQVARPRAAREAHPGLHDRVQADHDVEHLLPGAHPAERRARHRLDHARSGRARSSPPTVPSARSTPSSSAPASGSSTTRRS